MDKSLKLAFVLSATDKMSRVIDNAVKNSSSKLTAFERNTGKIGRSMMKAGGLITGAGAAIGAATFGIAKSTADYGDSMIKASRAAGMGVEDYQKLSYAAKYAGVEQNDLQAAMFRFSKNIAAAASGSGAAAQAFEGIGISVKDAAGNLREPNDILAEVADRFHDVPDGAAKTALAQELLGRSGAKMVSLLNTGSDGLREMAEEAARNGAVLSEDACAASEKFNDDLERVKDGVKGLSMQFGAVLMPMLNSLVEKIIKVVGKVTAWIKENPKLVKTVSKIALAVAGLLLVFGTASVVIGGIVFVVGKVVSVARKVVQAVKLASNVIRAFNLVLLKNPFVLIIGLVIAVGVAVYMLIKHWDKVKAFFAKLWEGIKGIFRKAWEWIKNMFLNYTPVGLVIKHWDKIKAFFSKLWEGVKGVFRKAWEWIKNMFLNYTPHGLIIKHWDKIKAFFSKLWEGVKNVFRKAWQWIKNLFLNYTPHGLIIKHWDKIVEFFSGLWNRIKGTAAQAWEGIKSVVTKPIEWVKNAWNGIGEFFSGLGTKFFEWGKNIISSLWEGIKSIANKAVEEVKGVGRKIANGIKSFFGINSPSKLMMSYGVNITEGLAEGISSNENTAAGASKSLALETMQGISAASVPEVNTSNNVSNNAYAGASIVYSPNITINGDMTPAQQQDFRALLKAHAAEIVEIMRREAKERERLAFA